MPEVNETITAHKEKKIGASKALQGDETLKSDVLSSKEKTWVTGDSRLFQALIERADLLYITQVNGVFDCDEEFPSFESKFALIKRSSIQKENGTEFQYQVWKNRKLLSAANLQES